MGSVSGARIRRPLHRWPLTVESGSAAPADPPFRLAA